MTKLKTVFVDIDDTLYSTTDFTRIARFNAIDEMIRVGLRIDRESCYEILEDIVREFSSNDSNHFNKLLHRLPEDATRDINDSLILAAGVSGYHNTKFTDLKPFDDVAEWLPEIAELPLRLGVISSGLSLKQAEKLVRLGLHNYFDPDIIFITEEVGIGKINVKLYEYACRKAEIKPEEALHVGDNPATDIDVAHEAGLVTVLREGAGKHANDPAEHNPDHRISDFKGLYGILTDTYQVG